MLFNSPISPQKANRLISILDLPEAAQVLDIGCGSGEFLVRVLETYPVIGRGIDRLETCITEAQNRLVGRVDPERCIFQCADIQALPMEANSLDLLICMGASQAFATAEKAYPALLQQCMYLLKPSGLALIGEAFWQQTPEPAYLALIGEPSGIYLDHAGNIALAELHGFVPLYTTTSNTDEWDDFEWSHRMKIEKKAANSPKDPEWAIKLKHSRTWRDGYLRWGRTTMGFGFYLFQKPAGPDWS